MRGSCKVASLSLFYCYHFGHCSHELAACISPPMAHYIPHSRQHLTTTIVWNSPMRELIGSVMVSSLLLPTFGTPSFFCNFCLPFLKRQVYHHLRDHMAQFFFITLFRYFINLFYSFQYLSFPFLKGDGVVKIDRF